MFGFLIQGAGLGISAALSPGPFQSLIIAQSLARGWRQTLPIIVAPLLGDIPIAILMVVLLRQVPAAFLRLISLAGSALLIYLAWGIIKELKSPIPDDEIDDVETLSNARGFIMGLAMLYMSPGSYLYWSLVLGPLLLKAVEMSLSTALVFLFGFYLLSIGGLVILAILLSRLGAVSDILKQRLQLVSLVLMLGVAAILIVGALTT